MQFSDECTIVNLREHGSRGVWVIIEPESQQGIQWSILFVVFFTSIEPIDFSNRRIKLFLLLSLFTLFDNAAVGSTAAKPTDRKSVV